MIVKLLLVKKFHSLLILLFLMNSILVNAQVYPFSDPSNTGNWLLNQSMSDEFDQAQLDEVKWQIQGKDGIYKSNFIGRAPSQFSPNNAIVENDKLKIRTKWEPGFNFSTTPQDGVAYENITTAAVISKQQFQYGYMEIKSKAAKAEITSSFWTTGFQSELDMFEMFGDPKDVTLDWRKRLKFNMISWDPNNTYYLPDGLGPAHTRNIQANDNTADAFHVYGFEWTSEYIKVYIDGVLNPNGTILKSDITNNGTDNDRWVTDVPYWIWFDSETFYWLGLPDATDLAVPVDYEIEYIRVWQINSAEDQVSVIGTLDCAEPYTNGEFKASLPNGELANQDIVVNYTVGGTATEGIDFATMSGTVTILNGNNNTLIPVFVMDDGDVEGDETIIITLSSANVGTVNTTPAEISIVDRGTGTILTAGDLAIVGWKAEGASNGVVAFMLLKDIGADTKISFSNRSWKGTQDGWTGDYSIDDVWTWTADASFSVGTIFKLDSDGFIKRTIGGTEVVVGNMSHDVLGKVDSADDDSDFDLSNNGDSVLIYQVYGNFSEPIDPLSSAWITGININDGWGTGGGNTFSSLPTALTVGLNANAVGTDQDNGVYQGELLGDVSSLRANINNSANWITSEDVNYNLWSYIETIGTNNFGNIGIGGTLGVSNYQLNDDILIYPNPINTTLLKSINISAREAKQIVLYNIAGTQLLSLEKTTEPFKLPVNNLKSGLYFISLISDTTIENKKIIIK